MNPEEQGPSVLIKGSCASLAWVCSDEREVTLTQLQIKKGASREDDGLVYPTNKEIKANVSEESLKGVEGL